MKILVRKKIPLMKKRKRKAVKKAKIRSRLHKLIPKIRKPRKPQLCPIQVLPVELPNINNSQVFNNLVASILSNP